MKRGEQKEMKRNHKLYEWAFAYRIKIQWKPNHTKEKRSAQCSGWRVFDWRDLVRHISVSEMNETRADREKEIRPAKYSFCCCWTENINLCYSIRHYVSGTLHCISILFVHSLFLSTSKKCQFLIYVSFSSQLYGFTKIKLKIYMKEQSGWKKTMMMEIRRRGKKHIENLSTVKIFQKHRTFWQ